MTGVVDRVIKNKDISSLYAYLRDLNESWIILVANSFSVGPFTPAFAAIFSPRLFYQRLIFHGINDQLLSQNWHRSGVEMFKIFNRAVLFKPRNYRTF